MKLLAQISMVVALDVFDDSKCDRKICPDSPVKNVPLTGFVFLVEQDAEDDLLFLAFPVVLWIDTPYAVEIAITEKCNQAVVFLPPITHIFFSTWFA